MKDADYEMPVEDSWRTTARQEWVNLWIGGNKV